MAETNQPWVKLAELRGDLSQSGLDRLIERPRGTTAQIEAGKLLPPDFDLSAKIDVALGLTPGTTWGYAAPDRLKRLDPHLAEWKKKETDLARGIPITDAEVRTLRLLTGLVQRQFGWVEKDLGERPRAVQEAAWFAQEHRRIHGEIAKLLTAIAGSIEGETDLLLLVETLGLLPQDRLVRLLNRLRLLAMDAALDAGVTTGRLGDDPERARRVVDFWLQKEHAQDLEAIAARSNATRSKKETPDAE